MSGHSVFRSTTAILLAMSTAAIAAPTAPVAAHWTLSELPRTPVRAGAAFTVKLDAAIMPGWHLYALEEPEGGPLPTEIGIAEGDPLTLESVDEPTPRMMPDPVLRRSVGTYETHASFVLHLRLPHAVDPDGTGHILVRFQACNDRICLPPHTETLALSLASVMKP